MQIEKQAFYARGLWFPGVNYLPKTRLKKAKQYVILICDKFANSEV